MGNSPKNFSSKSNNLKSLKGNLPSTSNEEKYIRIEKLGEGSYGSVHKVKNKENGSVC